VAAVREEVVEVVEVVEEEEVEEVAVLEEVVEEEVVVVAPRPAVAAPRKWARPPPAPWVLRAPAGMPSRRARHCRNARISTCGHRPQERYRGPHKRSRISGRLVAWCASAWHF
jgi:hypothetical protein